jgi:hypothetical protein
MDRRTFNKLLALGGMGIESLSLENPAAASPVASPAELPKWPAQTYRRFSIDIHVPDWDPQLLGRFDAATYVGNIARAGFQSMLQYTNSHVGLCLWRTQVGHMHANMKGRDFFGEVVEECRRRGVHPLAYFSVIFDNWNFEHHPDWRILSAEGNNSRLQSRYGVVCPNSPYRDYVLACVQEIVSNYDLDGMFFDMTFWPEVCYCPHCAERFWREQNAELPRIVDWNDPTWRAFQKARPAWLLEFAETVTGAVKKIRPITVNHQYSTIFHNWTAGVPLELTQACDYVGGDFYGGPAQQSLVCKAYYGLTRTHPFEFHTSRTRIFNDHVTMKPVDELRTESLVATLHSAGLLLVDYINADGTQNPQVYDALKPLNEQRAVYEPYLGGELLTDVAVYFDKNSLYNPEENGVHITKLQAADNCPHRDAVIGAARVLRQGHIPYGVVTNINLEQLKNYRAAILPNVLELTAEQAEQFRVFVAAGGVLYASGVSSLERQPSHEPRFLLEDVLGVKYKGTVGSNRITYLTPQDVELSKAIWPQDHASFAGTMIRVDALPGSEVLATVTPPFVDPEVGRAIGSHFAAIHSNPPALTPGKDPAVVVHSFGQGRSVWIAAPMESKDEAVNIRLTQHLLRRVLTPPYRFEADAHPAVEMTLFHQPQSHRLLVSLLNVQPLTPSIPVAATVRVQLPSGRTPGKVLRVPDSKLIPCQKKGPYLEFKTEPFDVFFMAVVEYA